MKHLIKLFIVLVIVLGALRFFFPPLSELGYATSETEVSAQVMFDRKGGTDPLKIYVEAVEGLDQSAFSDEICDSLAADMASGDLPLTGLNPTGDIEVLFVGGGRYFYRFADAEIYLFSYGPDGCETRETATDG